MPGKRAPEKSKPKETGLYALLATLFVFGSLLASFLAALLRGVKILLNLKAEGKEATPAAQGSYLRLRTVQQALRGLMWAMLMVAGVAILLMVYFLTLGTPPEAIVPPRPEQEIVDLRPRVQGLSEQRNALESAQLERIGAYRWIDREAGIFHIPIDRAMQIFAERQP
jgi:hypothetical protein